MEDITRQEFALDRDCLPSGKPLLKSYYHGVCAKPLSCQTTGDILEEAASVYPDRETFIVPEFDQSLTRKELMEKANRLSFSLIKLGLKSGDKVGVFGVSDVEYFVIFFATTQIGGIFLAPVFEAPVYQHTKRILELNLAFVFIGRSHNKESVDAIRDCESGGSLIPKVIEVNASTNNKYLTYGSLFDSIEDYSYETVHHERKGVNVESPALIVISSGTSTGRDKAVCMSHHTLMNTALFMYERLAMKGGERISTLNPIYDDISATMQMLITMCLDRVSVVAPTSLSIGSGGEDFLTFIEKQRINWHAGLPFQWLNILKMENPNKYNVSQLRGGHLAGQAFTSESRKALLERFPDMSIIFGSTEALAGLATSPRLSTLEQKLHTVGYPLPHCEVKLVNEGGAIVPIGCQGEICIRGWPVLTEYSNEKDLTLTVKPPTNNGWYHYGDIGIMDETGHVTYVGRKSDCVRFKHYTEAVYPDKILSAINKFEKIRIAKVIGIPNEMIGDDIVLCVEPHEGVQVDDEEVRTFLENTNTFMEIELPDYYFVFEQLPRTGGRRKISTSKLKALVETKLREIKAANTN